MIRSTIALFLLLVVPVRANLGETIQQCVARYGKPLQFSEASGKMPFGTIAFVAGGYQLVVFVLNDKEVGARVSKSNKSAFTDAERQSIMAADAGTGWTPIPSNDPTCLEWSRSDHATVLYDHVKNILIFTAPEMATALHSVPGK